MNIDQHWDDIIIGAGSSGAVLASRLSEQPDRRVLLVEAGPDFAHADRMPAPLNDARSPVMTGYNWDFTASLHGGGLAQNRLQQFPYPVGKVVGGSSAINNTLALRPFEEDFDKWCALGNPEWSWQQVLPYFMKIESDHDFPGERHGGNGPVPITRPQAKDWHALQAAFYTACNDIGLPGLADFNASPSIGVGPVPSNSIGSVRVSTASAYLAQARTRANLAILADSVVHRLLFEGQRAVGIELNDGQGRRRQITGRRITVSAGAINTVAILQRSGIADARLCRSLQIPLVADLPGVGENLSDHPVIILWMVPRAGVCQPGMPTHQIMARAASKPGRHPDINLFMLSNVITAQMPSLSNLLRTPLASGISVVTTNPASRGRVYLEHAAEGKKPVIELNLGAASEDIEYLMQGIRLAWRLVRSHPIAERTESIFMWNESIINNDNFLKSAINRFMGTTWHAAGTARMGPADDPMAVVDQYCRVHGIEQLRVVDASVMPVIPSTSTNLSCMMLAERVADWMRQGGA